MSEDQPHFAWYAKRDGEWEAIGRSLEDYMNPLERARKQTTLTISAEEMDRARMSLLEFHKLFYAEMLEQINEEHRIAQSN